MKERRYSLASQPLGLAASCRGYSSTRLHSGRKPLHLPSSHIPAIVRSLTWESSSTDRMKYHQAWFFFSFLHLSYLCLDSLFCCRPSQPGDPGTTKNTRRNIKILVPGLPASSDFLLLSSYGFRSQHPAFADTFGSYNLAPPSHLTSVGIGHVTSLHYPSRRAGLSIAPFSGLLEVPLRPWAKAPCPVLTQNNYYTPASTRLPSLTYLRGPKRNLGGSSVLTQDLEK